MRDRRQTGCPCRLRCNGYAGAPSGGRSSRRRATVGLSPVNGARLAGALDNAADQRLTSRSDYIPVALLDRFKADGIDLGGAAMSGEDAGERCLRPTLPPR
jgi:hypothetical protein